MVWNTYDDGLDNVKKNENVAVFILPGYFFSLGRSYFIKLYNIHFFLSATPLDGYLCTIDDGIEV